MTSIYENIKLNCDFYELDVPYEHKNIAKEKKCFFNPESKNWCVHPKNKNYDEMVKLYNRVYLIDNFDNKDLYKKGGAKWNPQNKMWFTYRSNETLKEYFEDE